MPYLPIATEKLENSDLQNLVIEIYGISNLHKFSQQTTARNLSLRAALLENVSYKLDAGEVVGIEYKGKKARARVVWVCEVESSTTTQIGVEILTGDACPWKEAILPEGEECQYDGKDRRKHERIALPLGIDLQQSGELLTMRTRLLDVSIGGCYVEMSSTIPVGTKLKIGLWLDSERVTATAIVRTSDPGFGIGIEFVDMSSEEEHRLQMFLRPFLSLPRSGLTIH